MFSTKLRKLCKASLTALLRKSLTRTDADMIVVSVHIPLPLHFHYIVRGNRARASCYPLTLAVLHPVPVCVRPDPTQQLRHADKHWRHILWITFLPFVSSLQYFFYSPCFTPTTGNANKSIPEQKKCVGQIYLMFKYKYVVKHKSAKLLIMYAEGKL